MTENKPDANQSFYENRGIYTPADLAALPEKPGVYLMKDATGTVIYVGKAKILKKRVSSYFQKRDHDLKTRLMVENISVIDTFAVTSESEALILEANLIKQYMPRFNVMFKDNKFYPFVKVTMKDRFPRIVFSREQKKDGSLYFGPYTSARAVREYIDLVQRLFLLRTCIELPKKECLNYHIKRCSAPCIQKITHEEYKKNVKRALKFLAGDFGTLARELESEMKEAAKALLFEKAQLIKEKWEAVQAFSESQSVFLNKDISADFIGSHTAMGKTVFVITIIRGGRMVGKRSYTATLPLDEEVEDVTVQFLISYAGITDDGIPLVVEPALEPRFGELNTVFAASGLNTTVTVPADDRQRSLVKMACENASLQLSQILSKVEASEGLNLLQKELGLDRLPMRIEGFDIANILGEFAVASLISFYGGKPDKKNYRHFNIKGKDTPDDFAMIHEAVYRRYKRLRDDGEEMPDLIMIDGGKGQLNAAREALCELGLELNVCSLAKQFEEIYIPHHHEPIRLPRNSPALHVLQQVRDETHRFANSFYNQRKGAALVENVFDSIDGIGEKRKQIIMQKFLNYDIIKKLRLEDITAEGIPEESARAVLAMLKKMARQDNE